MTLPIILLSKALNHQCRWTITNFTSLTIVYPIYRPRPEIAELLPLVHCSLLQGVEDRPYSFSEFSVAR